MAVLTILSFYCCSLWLRALAFIKSKSAMQHVNKKEGRLALQLEDNGGVFGRPY